MSTVIVITNFSASSRNALDYTCAFVHNPQTQVLLLNIYSFPGLFSNDAIALAAMSETIANDERKLQAEYDWAKAKYPHINLQTEMVSGTFMEVLRQQEAEEGLSLVVMGADGHYNDLLAWDVNIIDAFADLKTPVLVIPATVQYRPVQRIAFAVNYYRKNLQAPVAKIRRIMQYTQAQLYVINVVAPTEVIDEEAENSKRSLQESLADLSPEYYEPSFASIFSAIDRFTEEKQIDMLIVIPSRHGIWYNIFKQSHTKGLVYLNHIPVLSLRQEGNFI